MADVWTDDGTYLDPLMSGAGHDGIAAMIGGAQQQFPEHRFELSFGPDAHNDRVRFAWRLYGPGGDAPVAAGTDFGGGSVRAGQLAGARYGVIATIRSIGTRARSASSGSTRTRGPRSRRASRSFGSVIIFM